MFPITDKTAAPHEQFYCFGLIFPALVYWNTRYNQFLYMELYIIAALFIPRAYLTGCILMNILPFTLLARARPTFSPVRFFSAAVCRTQTGKPSALWIINRPDLDKLFGNADGDRLPWRSTWESIYAQRDHFAGPRAKGAAWYDRNIEYQYVPMCTR